jgi:hypothetical protein
MEEKTPLRQKLLAALTFWRRRGPRAYAIYTHPARKTLAIKRGFCWPATLVTLLLLPLRFVSGDLTPYWLILFTLSPVLWPLSRWLWSHAFAIFLVQFTALIGTVTALNFAPVYAALYVQIALLVEILLVSGIVGRGVNGWTAQKRLIQHYTRQIEFQTRSKKEALLRWETHLDKVRRPL